MNGHGGWAEKANWSDRFGLRRAENQVNGIATIYFFTEMPSPDDCRWVFDRAIIQMKNSETAIGTERAGVKDGASAFMSDCLKMKIGIPLPLLFAAKGFTSKIPFVKYIAGFSCMPPDISRLSSADDDEIIKFIDEHK